MPRKQCTQIVSEEKIDSCQGILRLSNHLQPYRFHRQDGSLAVVPAPISDAALQDCGPCNACLQPGLLHQLRVGGGIPMQAHLGCLAKPHVRSMYKSDRLLSDGGNLQHSYGQPDLDHAALCCVEAPCKQEKENCVERHVPPRKLVSGLPSEQVLLWSCAMLTCCLLHSVCVASILRMPYLTDINLMTDPTCMRNFTLPFLPIFPFFRVYFFALPTYTLYI